MGPRGPTLPSKQYVSILSQNLRGFNSAKVAELIHLLKQRQIWAASLHETWRHGDDVHENEGFTFLEHGLAAKVCHPPPPLVSPSRHSPSRAARAAQPND